MSRKRTAKSSSRWRRYAVAGGWLMLKLALVVLCILVIYLIYLDSKITRQFAGQKWEVPAQIYSRSMTLYAGKHLSSKALIDELERLQYQRTSGLQAPGQYSVSRNQISVYRRAFTFIDGLEAPQLFRLDFKGDQIAGVTLLKSSAKAEMVRLEPQLIEHLVSPHQEERELVRLEQVPASIRETLLLVEDRNFYHHHGVSPWAVLRAFLVNLSAGKTVQGGSTLTQQLAKNMYLSHDRTLWRKINEAFIALILEFRFSKDQLLEAYINEVFVGQNHANAVHGLGLGSRFYFAKPLTELQPAEYALLIGLLKGPSYYDPRRYPQRAQQRRDLVLRLMFEQHVLDQKTYQQAVASTLQLAGRGQYLQAGYAAYLAQVKRELRQLPLDNALMHSGIKVFTLLDPAAQFAASQAVKQQLAPMAAELQAAVVVADYRQAQILAIIGGRDNDSGFNRALDARRQIGSVIKPAIYLEALSQQGRYTLGTLLDDSPLQLRSNQDNWQPQNFDKTFRGPVPLITAVKDSLNIPTVRLGLQLGLPAVGNSLAKLGLTRKVRLHPAALLGAIELSPLEVAQLYQTIANDGVYQPLTTIEAVTDAEGHVLHQQLVQRQRRYPAEAVYLMQYALAESTRTGTGKALQHMLPGKVLAGKTGTSSDYRDSWFSGFDQDTLLTIWLGRDDNKPIGLTGGNGALPVFGRYFQLKGHHSLQLLPPERVKLQAFSAKSGYAVAQSCSNILLLPAISLDMPAAALCD